MKDLQTILAVFDLIRILIYTPLFILYFLEFAFLNEIKDVKRWESLAFSILFFISANIVVLDNTLYTVFPANFSRHFLTVPSLFLFGYVLVEKRYRLLKSVYFKNGKVFIETEKEL